ncbi:MAG: substrate-binding domain-containing protein [Enterocloster bolteae]
MPVTIVNGTPNANVDLSHLYGVPNDIASMSKTCGQISAPIVKDVWGQASKNSSLQFAALANEASSTRVNAFLDALTNEGVNYSVVTDQDAWMQDEAIQVAGDVITGNPDLDIIFCANEGAIVGSTMAVKNAGKEGQIYVFGIDVSVQISQMMRESDICQVAVGQNSYEGGYRAAELCFQVFMGDKSTEQYVQKWNACEDMVLNQREPETIDIYEQQMKDLGVMK